MRLDHLLSRDLGACEGAGGARGRVPWVLSWPVGGPDEQHGSTLPSSFLGVGGARLSCCGGWGHAVGVWGCVPFVSCFCFPLLCCCLFGGGVGGCGGVGGLVVNCIVDASIFVLCGVFLLCASRPGPAALFVVGSGAWFACVVCCFYGRSVDALAPGADEGRGGLR